MRNLKYGLLVFTTSFFLFNCQHTHGFTVKTLGKGDMAPYKGYLYNPSADKAARVALLENDQYKVLVNEQYELIKIGDRQIANREEMIKVLKIKAEDNTYMNILYFVGGAIIGGLVTHELKR